MSPTPLGEQLIELVDEQGQRIGTSSKGIVHSKPGYLHRAFSVFLLDTQGRLLIQRRASGKYHSPLLWSNTCCGHPYPGEQPAAATVRRLQEELGATVAPQDLVSAGSVTYALTDETTGLVEREFNHLFVGPMPGDLELNAAEVAEVRLLPLDQCDPPEPGADFTVWFPTVFQAARRSLEDVARAYQALGADAQG